MVEAFSIARPYAKALFELALSHHSLQEWETILQIYAAAIENPRINKMIRDPKITSKQWILFLLECLPENILNKEPSLKSQVTQFIDLIMANQRMIILPAIYEQFQQLLIAHSETTLLSITSAYQLDDKISNQLLNVLQKKFGPHVTIHYKIDPSLIGGIVIRHNHWVLDASIKNKLQRLNHYLINEAPMLQDKM